MRKVRCTTVRGRTLPIHAVIVAISLGLLAMTGSICGRAADTRDSTRHAAEEAQAKRKLESVREQIRKITDEQRHTNAEKSAATDALRDQELKISATAKQLRALDEQLADERHKLDDLVAMRALLDIKLKDQREALAALIRSAYAMGGDAQLRLLLEQDDIDKVGRMLAYYGYFKRARVSQIDGLLADLGSLAQVHTQIERQNAALKQSRDERADQATQMQIERDTRNRLVLALDAKLETQSQRIAQLSRDEKGLLDLLAKLRDIFADIPAQVNNARPIETLRGRLPWPVRGKIVAGFGASDNADQSNQGVLIAASIGQQVRAVAHGRVVYADWLRGYGLLLIVDHGDGYLSLYGGDETLLKDVGDWVDAGDVIATSGDSGGRKTPGLYFELRHQRKPLDPMRWLLTPSR